MKIKFLGILPVSRRQFELIEAFFFIFFFFLTIFFFMYRFPAYVDDPLILYHAKLLKYMALISTFLTVIEYEYVIGRLINHQKQVIEEQKEEILNQKEEIEKQRDLTQKQYQIILEQKKHITDSIVYASAIQRSLLPDSVNYLDELDYFVFFRPKEIVSGDFYWFYRKNDRLFIVAADCTGHGVPGAFMSLLGITYLNDIILKSRENVMPHEILEALRTRIIKTFEKNDGSEGRKDGMDIALYILEPNRKTLHFAGANNPLFLVRKISNNNLPAEDVNIKITYDNDYALIHIKADKMPIGNFKSIKPFTYHTLQIKPGDSLYTFSDGILDQFGGEYGKRFSTSRFKKLILSIQELSMREQKIFIEEAIDDWMNLNKDLNIEQLDDMLVIGLRVVK